MSAAPANTHPPSVPRRIWDAISTLLCRPARPPSPQATSDPLSEPAPRPNLPLESTPPTLPVEGGPLVKISAQSHCEEQSAEESPAEAPKPLVDVAIPAHEGTNTVSGLAPTGSESIPPHEGLAADLPSSIIPTPQPCSILPADSRAPANDTFADNDAQLPAQSFQSFALIVGNNDYDASKGYSPLAFAEADADAIEELLQELLGPMKIVSKRNATRQEILDGFDELEKITEGTSNPRIIIFYAGHGGQVPRPEEWKDYTTDHDKVEILCPSDLGAEQKDGGVVEGIPDRVIGSFLSQLARKRGDNITLILDCCHSASLNRDEDTDSTSRCLRNPPPVTAKANASYLLTYDDSFNQEATRGVDFAPGFGSQSTESHVLLAACGREETAYEDRKEKHGYFTRELIRYLRTRKGKLEAETSLSLITSLRMPDKQVPHCIGANRSRPLFNHHGPQSDGSYVQCDATGPRNQQVFTLFAGQVQGVLPNDLFYVYRLAPFRGQESSQKPFGQMRAVRVDRTSTALELIDTRQRTDVPAPKIPKIFYAKLAWSSAHGTIYCADEELFKSLSSYQKTIKTASGDVAHVANSPALASLVITVEGNEVLMERNDPVLNAHLPSRFPYVLNRQVPMKIQRVITGWRHFHYQLHRKPASDEFRQIRIELHYLKPKGGNWGDKNADYIPYGPNLFAGESAVHEIKVSQEQIGKPLGFTLYNDGDVDVYPYLFYFNPTKLTITPWLLVAAGKGRVDPPLTAHSQLAVGYGNGGAAPLRFTFQKGETKDFGILRLFVTRDPANMRSISQVQSPFTSYGRTEDGGENQGEELEDGWGVKTAALVQSKI